MREKELAKMHIGVLEDNPGIIDLITTMLELAGHCVSAYREGKAFLEAFSKPPVSYDLLIVDLGLPGGLSGLDVLQSVQQSGSSSVLPIIVVSGASQHELAHIQIHYPTIPIVRKPFKIRSLLQLIEQTQQDKSMSC